MAGSAKPAETVLLLHGLWVGGLAMGWLSRALRGAGFATRVVAYRSMSGSPDEHVERLAQAVVEARDGRTHLLGHSMGGVVVLRYLLDRSPSGLGRVLLLGTPALGCKAALAFERQAWGPVLLGESLALWRARFPGALDARFDVGAVAGSHAFGLGALFVPLPGPGDGVVRVDETRIPGLRDHIVLPVSHTGMLFSRAVACQAIAFLQTGAFVR